MSALEDVLDAYAGGPWGPALSDPQSAKDLCKRASLVLMAQLEDVGISAELHCLAASAQHPNTQHFVIKLGEEGIDVSARQFDASAPFPKRAPYKELSRGWEPDHPIDLRDRWDLKLHNIPENWPDLRDVGPPGELPDWPYEHEWTPPSDASPST